MRVPVDVWHTREDIKERLKKENTEEAERLLRQLNKKEFWSNALSYCATFSLAVTVTILVWIITSIGLESFSLSLLTIMAVITFFLFYGSMRLQESATASIIKHFKTRKNTSTIKTAEKEKTKDIL